MVRATLVVMLLVMLALTASADVFAYKTDEGVFAYTDDEKKVPGKYRNSMAVISGPVNPDAPITKLSPDADMANILMSKRLQWYRAQQRAEEAERAALDRARAGAPRTIVKMRPKMIIRLPGRDERLRHRPGQREAY